MDIKQQIHDILVDVLMLEDPSVVRPDAHVVKDLGAESINIAELVVALENEFDITVTSEAIQQATTVQSLVDLVEAAVAQRTRAAP